MRRLIDLLKEGKGLRREGEEVFSEGGGVVEALAVGRIDISVCMYLYLYLCICVMSMSISMYVNLYVYVSVSMCMCVCWGRGRWGIYWARQTCAPTHQRRRT